MWRHPLGLWCAFAVVSALASARGAAPPAGGPAAPGTAAIGVETLLLEMADFENLARKPEPFFKKAMASSYDRASREGGEDGEAWFANHDVGQYVRTERNAGRTEHVLADLKGPGAVVRFWSANPANRQAMRFYFDGESAPRLEAPLQAFFSGALAPFDPEFSYVSGTGGNLYYPIPYGESLKITVEEQDRPVLLYYEIDYRAYPAGTAVRTFDPAGAARWAETQRAAVRALAHPRPASPPGEAREIAERLTIPPGETGALPPILGEQAVFTWSARAAETTESAAWDDPRRAHNALRFLVLRIDFDGARSIETPLGDFFGSAPGLNPYENLFFTVGADGWMTSRLLMPFARSMEFRIENVGPIAYTVELKFLAGARAFTPRDLHLRAQWAALTRHTRPFFDTPLLETEGAGKVVGSVYQIANPVLIWWGEGDQKIYVDGEPFPSTFGTGTEDDYGFAYGHNRPFVRPYHAQTRVDGPASGGHVSLNRWYVLDAIPYAARIRFLQEMWHWMPCIPTWTHVVYWYAAPGSGGPRPVARGALAPRDLGPRERMLDPIEGEALPCEATGGSVRKERLANCLGAAHLVWRGSKPGDRLRVHFAAPAAGRYRIELNLCLAPDYGRQRISVNGQAAEAVIDCYSPRLSWLQAVLGVFDLREGKNTLDVETLAPNPAATGANLFGLDYVFLRRE
ncbi:MAG TPA: DUF2961 domain-containing protein [Planctomycetota bacterium]|jgi:hypothetical protein|nr:DUF2961 domain-containing protein [Planctomycetota bacterium]OQC20801.1 MAG: hypothetical protein BWX69_01427 [Planctomycetes bacterium ADurb.Bin069]HNR99361.1 DUF2961 domain-containing protein [Planctomycetota bacterium]HOE30045.1 DUF2961 domain-containing protein [Planctomycetota bacterium]HOE87096.1 DUF2961 domain-containing protein [Planctomycetota bacterium]